MDLWVGDGGAATGADVVQRVPISRGTCRVGRRSTAVRRRRGWKARNPEGDARPRHSGGRRPRGRRARGHERWRHDRVRVVHRQHTGPLDRGCERSPEDPVGSLGDRRAGGGHAGRSVGALTPRSLGGSVSIWMVSIEGGSPTKLTDGSNVAVSPDGGSIAFNAWVNGVTSLLVCSLPGCSSPRRIGAAQLRHGGRLAAGRSRRRLREQRESLGAAPQRRRSASADTLHRRAPDSILCVVARRAATGHHAIDRHQPQ